MKFRGSKKIKEILINYYLKIPLPYSKYIYSIGRQFFKDPRKSYFERAFETVNSKGVAGDYLEFGVFRGTSFITAYKIAKRKNMMANMRFFAFDSFEGLPQDEGEKFKRGSMKCEENQFINIIENAGVNLDKIVIVKGYYNESLNNKIKIIHKLHKASIVHIDCDLYSSTKEVLSFISDLIQNGTILIFECYRSIKER